MSGFQIIGKQLTGSGRSLARPQPPGGRVGPGRDGPGRAGNGPAGPGSESAGPGAAQGSTGGLGRAGAARAAAAASESESHWLSAAQHWKPPRPGGRRGGCIGPGPAAGAPGAARRACPAAAAVTALLMIGNAG